jgi:hypothetical protein
MIAFLLAACLLALPASIPALAVPPRVGPVQFVEFFSPI